MDWPVGLLLSLLTESTKTCWDSSLEFLCTYRVAQNLLRFVAWVSVYLQSRPKLAEIRRLSFCVLTESTKTRWDSSLEFLCTYRVDQNLLRFVAWVSVLTESTKTRWDSSLEFLCTYRVDQNSLRFVAWVSVYLQSRPKLAEIRRLSFCVLTESTKTRWDSSLEFLCTYRVDQNSLRFVAWVSVYLQSRPKLAEIRRLSFCVLTESTKTCWDSSLEFLCTYRVDQNSLRSVAWVSVYLQSRPKLAEIRRLSFCVLTESTKTRWDSSLEFLCTYRVDQNLLRFVAWVSVYLQSRPKLAEIRRLSFCVLTESTKTRWDSSLEFLCTYRVDQNLLRFVAWVSVCLQSRPKLAEIRRLSFCVLTESTKTCWDSSLEFLCTYRVDQNLLRFVAWVSVYLQSRPKLAEIRRLSFCVLTESTKTCWDSSLEFLNPANLLSVFSCN